jgi:hypothetical protein
MPQFNDLRFGLDVSPLSGAEIDESLSETYAAPSDLIKKAIAISELR